MSTASSGLWDNDGGCRLTMRGGGGERCELPLAEPEASGMSRPFSLSAPSSAATLASSTELYAALMSALGGFPARLTVRFQTQVHLDTARLSSSVHSSSKGLEVSCKFHALSSPCRSHLSLSRRHSAVSNRPVCAHLETPEIGKGRRGQLTRAAQPFPLRWPIIGILANAAAPRTAVVCCIGHVREDVAIAKTKMR